MMFQTDEAYEEISLPTSQQSGGLRKLGSIHAIPYCQDAVASLEEEGRCLRPARRLHVSGTLLICQGLARFSRVGYY